MQQLLETAKKKLIKVGDVVQGKVLGKEARRMFVDLGAYGTGVVLGKEYLDSLNSIKNLKVGDEFAVKVVGPINEDGFWELSLSEADRQAAWQKLQALKDSKETISVVVSGMNYGGLLLQVYGIEGFLPVSQLSLDHYPRVEGGEKSKILEELRKFTGTEVKVKVLDADEKENKLIFSEREAQKNEILKAISQYKVGDTVAGEVTGLADFGIFIKFGEEFPLEGLIHISEIDYDLVEDPGAYAKVGQHIQAQIINIKDDRIFLSLKTLKKDPWESSLDKFKTDSLHKARVLKINPVGALLSFNEGIYGICPLENFDNDIEKAKAALESGKEYEFKIVGRDEKEKKVIAALNK